MNMAIDEAVLKNACIRQEGATLRFYTWSAPAISIGCLQKIPGNFDLAQSEQLGLKAVRRPSGGRIVLHKGDLTYSLVFAENNPTIPQGIMASYQKISQAVKWGLNSLGIPAQLCPERKINRSPFCFSLVARYEILVHGKKIIGNAQKRERGAVLQQGSIMMENHRELLYQLFGKHFSLMSAGKNPAGRAAKNAATDENPAGSAATDDHSVTDEHPASYEHSDDGGGEEKFTSVEEVLGGPVSVSLVKEAMIRGFEKVLNISLVPGLLTGWEEQEAIRLCREKYSQDCWNKEGHL